MANIDIFKSSGDVFDVEIRGYIEKTGEYASAEQADTFGLMIKKNGRLHVLTFFDTVEQAKAYANNVIS
jgi:hypothetical protein